MNIDFKQFTKFFKLYIYLNDVDEDGDGFVSAYDCDDKNAAINPFATDDPATNFDESCGAALGTRTFDLNDLGYYINGNPNDGNFSVISTNLEKYQVQLFSVTGQFIRKKEGIGVLEIKNIGSFGVYLVRIKSEGKIVGTSKIIVK